MLLNLVIFILIWIQFWYFCWFLSISRNSMSPQMSFAEVHFLKKFAKIIKNQQNVDSFKIPSTRLLLLKYIVYWKKNNKLQIVFQLCWMSTVDVRDFFGQVDFFFGGTKEKEKILIFFSNSKYIILISSKILVTFSIWVSPGKMYTLWAEGFQI